MMQTADAASASEGSAAGESGAAKLTTLAFSARVKLNIRSTLTQSLYKHHPGQ
jgi:hypothetical protein